LFGIKERSTTREANGRCVVGQFRGGWRRGHMNDSFGLTSFFSPKTKNQ
jgi:hypothetical protein